MVKNFNTTFWARNLTGNAGLVLVGRFAHKLGVDKLLQQHISITRGANAKYALPEIIIMVMMGALAGAKHISHLVILRNDSVLRAIFKWDLFPVASTFGRIFKLFTHRHCDELSRAENAPRRKVWANKFFGRVTLDLDSTVKGVFGSQEGAAKGFNPGASKTAKTSCPVFSLGVQ